MIFIMKTYRIKNRFKFTLFIVLTIILFTMTANFALGMNTADSSTIPQYMELEVSSGDTLWSIADRYRSDESDIRKSIYELGKINGISAVSYTHLDVYKRQGYRTHKEKYTPLCQASDNLVQKI